MWQLAIHWRFMRWPVVMLVFGTLGCTRPANRVVLYCAQDRPFAEAVLADFTKATGLAVAVKYDTEANKSVGLYRELQLEAARPRCDVHWNNEIITTLMLSGQGVLRPYEPPAAKTFPAFARAADHTWTAFAARARVVLVHTPSVPDHERPGSLFDLTDKKWSGRLAMAKPNFGTTATQAACLFAVLGSDRAKEYYRALKANGVRIYPGNKHVAEAVGRGEVAVGLTDTDDAMAEVLAGRPVAVIFTDSPDGIGTLFIPNTAAVIRGGPNPAGAENLVNYLLSPAVEAKLAVAGGFQIPLNPEVKADLPPALQPARTAKPMAVDFAKAAALWDEVQAFLRDEFAR